jgi:hypothetical protein
MPVSLPAVGAERILVLEILGRDLVEKGVDFFLAYGIGSSAVAAANLHFDLLGGDFGRLQF